MDSVRRVLALTTESKTARSGDFESPPGRNRFSLAAAADALLREHDALSRLVLSTEIHTRFIRVESNRPDRPDPTSPKGVGTLYSRLDTSCRTHGDSGFQSLSTGSQVAE
jgi:hypothetical protein